MKDHTDSIAEHNSSIQLLKTLGATRSGSNGDNGSSMIDALETLIENLRKECYAKFGDRQEQDSMKRRIDDIMNHLRELDHKSENHENSIYQCRDITDTNKLDIDDLKKKMKDITNQLANVVDHSHSLTDINNTHANTNSNANIHISNSNNDQTIADLLRRIAKLEKDLDNKLDCEVFDNEVALLRSMIGNLESDDKPKTKVQAPVAS
jgi:chromosome segregation ATPase